MMMAARATGKEPCMDDRLCSKENRELLHSAVCSRHPSCSLVCQSTWLHACMPQQSAPGHHNVCTAQCNRPWISEDFLCRSAQRIPRRGSEHTCMVENLPDAS